jgi:hypothetical protein
VIPSDATIVSPAYSTPSIMTTADRSPSDTFRAARILAIAASGHLAVGGVSGSRARAADHKAGH